MNLIGIDLGTTGCKSMIFDEQGNILSQSYIEYGIINGAETFIEQDADLWWTLVRQSVKECVLSAGAAGKNVAALSISSQGISFVAVDKAGKTLGNAISWLDTRPGKQTGAIREMFGEEKIFGITGKRISPCYSLPKMMWVKENQPEIYEKTDKFLMGLDFLTFRLTGKAVTDYSMASGTMLFNISAKKWDEEIIERCRLDIRKLPEVACTGSVVGDVLPEVAGELGLNGGVKVVLGAQDQKVAAIGAGITEDIATVSLGTATAISSIGKTPVFDREMRIPSFALDQDRWILESVVGTSCISLKWLKNTFYDGFSYGQLDELAMKSVPGANGVYFYPHLEGASTPYWRNDVKGFLYGFSLGTGREDVVRAVLEGIAYQIRINLDVQQQINGGSIDELRIFGGGSNSALWCSLIADITGKTVSILYTSEIANFGAAVLAGLGAGVYKSSADVLSRVHLIRKQYLPDPANRQKYDDAFQKYRTVQDKLLA